jgi:tRNA pseudouridine13 synthase
MRFKKMAEYCTFGIVIWGQYHRFVRWPLYSLGIVVYTRSPQRDEQRPGPSMPAEKPEIPEEQLKVLEGLTSGEFVQQLLELYKTPMVGSDGKRYWPKPVLSGPIEDKTQRTQIHQEIRKVFGSEIDTTTADGSIRASANPGARTKSRNQRARTHIDCPGEGQHLHFTMFKENRDTIEVTQMLRRMLGLKSSVLVAGTKDRRAATTQRCSVKLRMAGELSALNRKLGNVKTGDYQRRPNALRLGELQGNEFTIVIKDCRLPHDEQLPASERVSAFREVLESAAQHMYKHGWINYFGHQRFGTWDIRTHQVGMLIIGGRYEDAVKSVLHYNPKLLEDADLSKEYKRAGRSDDCARALAIKTFEETHDSTASQKHLPQRFMAERAIIGHLGRGASVAKDWAGALLNIPRSLRTLYLHSYQSLVWNHAAAKRWELYGGKVVEGDLVAVDPPSAERDTADQDRGDVVFVSEDPDDQDPTIIIPHVVTAEEVAVGKFSIFDVVLPSPGCSTKLPENEVRGFYTEFMARPENGGLDPENMPRRHKDFSVEGKYRRLLCRFLAEPSVEVRAYADNNEQLFSTDLDRIIERKKREEEERVAAANGKRSRDAEENDKAENDEGRAAKKTKVEAGDQAAGSNGSACETAVVAPEGDGAASAGETTGGDQASATTAPAKDKVAVILKFQLGRSAYATVVTRELGLSGDDIS